MVTETGLAEDTGSTDRAPAEGEVRRRRRSRRRVRVRKQTKFPRPVRLALWLGLPAVLWGGIWFALRLLD